MELAPVLLVIFVGLLTTTRAQISLEMKCGEFDLTPAAKFFWVIPDCLSAAGIKTIQDLSPMDGACYAKCVVEKKGLVDATGKPKKDNILAAVGDKFPESLRAAYKKEMDKCFDENEVTIPDDEHCTTFMPLAMCLHMSMFTICPH